MDPAARRFDGRLWTALLALVLAFGFLGSRPVWDPDEGRYSNVALNMLESGDWLHPMRSHEAGHWTKPPLTYWSVASSVAVLGYTTFAVRLPVALAYLAWFVYAPQCLSTIAVVKRETNSWGKTAIFVAYLFALAYLAAWATYRIARAVSG